MTNPPAVAENSAAGGLRLNLGGRDTVIPGFKTMDLHPGPNVEYSGDISDLSRFSDGSVDEIYASHCLEHFPHPKTESVLKEWRRVLKNGAACHISVPDVDAAMTLIAKDGLTDFVRNLLWGDQGYDLAYHYAGFNFAFLARLTFKAGFSDVRRIKWMPYEVRDCSRLIDTHYKIPISVTVKAIA